MNYWLKIPLCCFLIISFVGRCIAQKVRVPLDEEHWVLRGDAEFVEFDGRNALSGSAVLKDVEIANGIIEFDLYSTGARNFGGLMFRLQSSEDYEWCWIRTHKANGFVQDGVQYAPVFNGTACWQLNGDRNGIAPVRLPENEWVRVKVVLRGEIAELFVGASEAPVLVMDHLQLGVKRGKLGLRANRQNSVYFSNFVYEEISEDFLTTEKPVLEKGTLADWKISKSFKVEDFSELEEYPALRIEAETDWTDGEVERNGLLNISKIRKHQGRDPSCVILKTTLSSPEVKRVKLNFGYSDAAGIFLNGKPLFWGNNAYRGRNMADSLWISYNDAIFLDLNAGENELVVMVAEVFGGWGFQARLNSPSPVWNVFNR